jgi:hypothetical protein
MLASAAVLAGGSLGRYPSAGADQPKPDEPPSASSGTEPSGAAKTDAEAEPEPADNSYCYACHANYEDEELTTAHQPVGVGCEQCHGMSIDHSGDEDNIIPPEKMFVKSEITAYCMTCHEKPKLLVAEQKNHEHRDFFEKPDPEKTCNECHAEKHRLNVRTRIWDKKTGKLIKDDGVRMMQQMQLPTSP